MWLLVLVVGLSCRSDPYLLPSRFCELGCDQSSHSHEEQVGRRKSRAGNRPSPDHRLRTGRRRPGDGPREHGRHRVDPLPASRPTERDLTAHPPLQRYGSFEGWVSSVPVRSGEGNSRKAPKVVSSILTGPTIAPDFRTSGVPLLAFPTRWSRRALPRTLPAGAGRNRRFRRPGSGRPGSVSSADN